MKKLLFLALLSVASASYSMEEYLLYQVVVTLPQGHLHQEALARLKFKFDSLEHSIREFPDNEVVLIVNSPKKEILQRLQGDESWASNYKVIPEFMTGGPGGERPDFLDQDPSTMSERMREYVKDYKATYGE